MRYWLMKSEPSECSIDDAAAAPNATVPWVGVRNFQARNFMKKEMAPGDGVLFYHSSCPEPGIAGLAAEAPRWWHVDVKVLKKTRLLSLAEMRAAPELATMRVLRRGNRLSITPVSEEEWRAVTRLLDSPA